MDSLLENALKEHVRLLSECAMKYANNPNALAKIADALVHIHHCINP